MRGTRLYVLIATVVLLLFILVLARSCRSGNHPQSLDDNPERTTVSALALSYSPVA